MGYWKFIIMGDNKLNKHYDKILLLKPFLLMGKIQSEMNLVDKKGMKTVWHLVQLLFYSTFYILSTSDHAFGMPFYFILIPFNFPEERINSMKYG
jgi:hypothetical protein